MPAAVARDGVVAGLIAAGPSGLPSTLHALVTRADVLEAGRAAGALLLPRARSTPVLLAAAVPVHLALSAGWGVALAAAIPPRAGAPAAIVGGVVGGVAIYALDMGVIGHRIARIRALPPAPQLADHLAYGAAVGAALAWRRSRTARAARLAS